MYFSGIGNISSFGTWSWTRSSLWWRQMKSAWLDQKSHWASASSLDSDGWKPSGSPWRFSTENFAPTGLFPWVLGIRGLFLTILLHQLLLGIWNIPSSVVSIILSHWFFGIYFRCVPFLQFFNVCNQEIFFMHFREHTWKNFLSKVVEPWLVSCRNRKLFNHCTKRKNKTLKWFSESPFAPCFTVCQDIFNISHIVIAFHGTSPPSYIQAWLQQHSRRSFFYSAYHFISNTVRLGSMRCWCSMIPCQCKWLSALLSTRKTSATPFRLLGSFCFYTDTTGSIEWLNLVPRLRIRDCFEIRIIHWELCDLLLPCHQSFLL